MLIATYNVNSINARLENLLEWLKQNHPDVLLLQEIKTEFNGFPFLNCRARGMTPRFWGRKAITALRLSAAIS